MTATPNDERKLTEIFPDLEDAEARAAALRAIEEQRKALEGELDTKYARFLGRPTEHFLPKALVKLEEGGHGAERRPGSRRRRPWPWLALAAGLLLALGLLVARPWKSDGAPPSVDYLAALRSVADELPEPLRDPLQPDAFREFMPAQDLLRGNGEQVRIMEPRGGILETRPIFRFAWPAIQTGPLLTCRLTLIHELGETIDFEFQREVDRPETAVELLPGQALKSGHYTLILKSQIDQSELLAKAFFAVVPAELVQEIREKAHKTGNLLVDRHLLVARLLTDRDERNATLDMAKLALAELEAALEPGLSKEALLIHLMLQSRALGILGRDQEVKDIEQEWRRALFAPADE